MRLARPVIDRIAKEGKLPIVVGGTGFYLRALTDPPKTITIPPNWKLREKLANQSVRQLQKLVDPKRLALMNASDRQNPRRLIRAIEVAGREARLPKPRYETLWIGLTAPLPVLRDRIGTRIKKRWRQAAREVRGDLPPILGVAPLLAWLRGENTKDEAIRRWVTEEYQYARRQMTWFRKMADIHWFDVTQAGYTDRIFDLVRSWYT